MADGRVLRRTIAMLLLPVSALVAQSVALDAPTQATWAALLAVQDTRAADTTVIDRALASASAPLRAAAARVIGGNRIAARYGALRERLRSERDSAAAGDAAFALGLAQDSASCDVLQTALAVPSTGVAAAWALGELNTACGDFATLLPRATTHAARAGLLRVAVKWSPFPDTTVVRAYRSSQVPQVRWAALYALARGRRAAGAALAIEASRSPDSALRELAARLMAATLQPRADSGRVVARLEALLGDRAPHVRIAAARALATYRVLARPGFARAWAGERDANVRVTLAQSSATVLSDTSALWGAWWRGDTTHMVRRALLASAWQANAISALTAEPAALDTAADYRLRIAMLEGAAAAAPERNVARVVARLEDVDGRVRAAAISALAGMPVAVRAGIAWPSRLERALQDDDVGVRAAALTARARAEPAGRVDDAIVGFERALRDTIGEAREAALDLLASAWRSDSTTVTEAHRARLRAWPAPRDPLLVQRARRIPVLVHWQGTAPEAAPGEPYERIVREVVAPAVRGRPAVLRLATDRGVVRIVLDGVSAPMTADHLMRLARAGYFRNLRFHRVVPAFVAQGGDPRGDGTGGPGYAIRDELNRSPYRRGAVGMALSGPDTGGSQFFLTLAPQPHLDGHYTVVGHVRSGFTAMDALVQGDRMLDITVDAR